ncbi:5-methylcytosine-specific restriction protein A [Bradyrhizobium elkanii]
MALRVSRPRLAVHDTRTARPRPKQADAELLTPEHRAWRLTVCQRAGWRCEWIENGARCEASTKRGDVMIADHIVERADGGALYDVSNGQCLCVSHNTLKGLKSRRARFLDGH